jgi:signal transduction histidine kinase
MSEIPSFMRRPRKATMFGGLRTSIRLRLLLPLPVFAALVLIVLAIWVPRLILDNARQTAIVNATQIVNQYKAIRGYYTRDVVSVVMAGSDLVAAADHQDDPNAVPLPATMVHDLNEILQDQSTSVQLFSPYPFPLREERELDAFQSQAWEVLTSNPDQVLTRVERLDGGRVLRVAIADLMVDQSCVDCHNGHPDTPRAGWQLGQVRGVLEVRSDLDEQYAAARRASFMVLGLVAFLLILLTATFLLISNSVTAPLDRIIHNMRRLARSDSDVELKDLDRPDEIGEMARALEVFKASQLRRSEDERALSHYAEELQRSNAELQVFASAASHDLQEPLRKIQTFGERLQDKYSRELDETGEMYVDRMIDAATRMRKLIDALLIFSRVNTSNTHMTDVDLNGVMQEVLEDLGQQISECGGEVTVGSLPTVSADGTQLRIVFQNLISNALKFRAVDRPTKITVEVSKDKGQNKDVVQISVTDNGIGFDPRHAGRIFGMFERLHSRSEYEGTGVGLATCKKIAERHGGSLSAVSEPGSGSVFTLVLPLRQATLS